MAAPRSAVLAGAAAGILLLTFATYVPSLGNGFTNWDDPIYVQENPLLSHPSPQALLTQPVGGNYHPLTMLSFALNFRLSGLDPTSYHWLNLLLHLANTALVFVFLVRLCGGAWKAAAATSVFFGIHPMHVESVAWIAARKDVLYALFYLLGLIAYVRYLDGKRVAWLVATFVAAAFSLASKPAAAVFPLSLLAVDFYRARPLGPRAFVEKVPFLLLSITAGLLTLHAQAATGAIHAHQSGMSLQRLPLAAFALLMYVVRFLAPVHLSAVYPYPGAGGGHGAGPMLLAACVLVIAGAASVAILFRRNRAVLFGTAFFLVNIALVLPFVSIGNTFMADRYTYLPYVGLFFALTAGWDEPADSRARVRLRRMGIACLALLAMIFSALTWSRCGVWGDSGSLWTDVIRKYPHRVFAAYANRGHYRSETAARPEDALSDFEEAVALDPSYAEVWVGRGIALAQLGRNEEALGSFDRALAVAPGYVVALNDRGVMKMRGGDLAGAAEDFSRSIERDPTGRDAYANRSEVYEAIGEYERSIADARQVIHLDPGDPANHVLLGRIGDALERLGRHRDSIEAYGDAIRIAPGGDSRVGEYHLGRSRAWRALGDRVQALADARQAERLGTRVDPAYLRDLGG